MTTIDVATLQSRVAQAHATLSSLGTQLTSAAPSGEFDQVLKNAAAAVQSVLDPSTTSTTGTATAGLGSLSSLSSMGLGSLSPLGGGSVTGSDVVADATKYLGVPYQWGGTNPASGLDCSGLVQRVYGDLGVTLPRTSEEQATVGTAVPDLASAQPGDLVFFEPGANGPGHVGIYIGNGQMIDAPHTGTTVQVQAVGTPSAIRRILPSASRTVSGGSGLNVPPALAPLFLSAAATHNVPASLLAAVAQTESNFNPNAVSGAGAQGMMQFMPGTAAGLGINPFDPAQAVNGAAQMLSGLISQFGSVPLALAAYNAGPGAVEQYGRIPPYAETQAYVQKVLALAGGVGQ
jgi:cell wall-associated NlpC family hydrolase